MVSIRKQRISALKSLLTTLHSQLSVTTLCSQLSAPYSLLKTPSSKLYSKLSSQNSVLVSKWLVIPNKSQRTVVDLYLLSEQT